MVRRSEACFTPGMGFPGIAVPPWMDHPLSVFNRNLSSILQSLIFLQACSTAQGQVSTWMGDRLGTSGVVGITLFYYFCVRKATHVFARSAEKTQEIHEHEIVIASWPFDKSDGGALSNWIALYRGSKV